MTDPYINAQLIIYGDFGISILPKLEEEKIYAYIVNQFELMKDWNLNLDALLNFEVYN